MQSLKVPFVGNTNDDLHCQQAAYAMIRDYFKPGVYSYSWDEWSELTGYEENMGTWASSGLLWFESEGFKVLQVSLFDYVSFAKRGGDYLLEVFGEEVGSWQISHSNISKEQSLARRLVAKGLVEYREPLQDDIRSALDAGALLRCLVNSSVFAGRGGYVGHAIVVSGYDDTGFTIQDPGLPPLPNRHVVYEVFEKAWACPNKEAKELDIISK